MHTHTCMHAEAGVDMHATDERGNTALHVACGGDSVDVVNLLGGCVCVPVCVYICTRTFCTHACMHACMHVCMHMHTLSHKHTQTHTHGS